MPKNAQKGKLIVFLGPVGVGKSTIIRGLAQVLKTRGFRVFTIFIKAFHGPVYVLWILTVKLLGLGSRYAPWFIIPKSGRINLAKMLMVVSIYLDAFFSIPLKLIVTRILRHAGYYILSEEYIQSTLFDYIFTFINFNIKSKYINISMKVLYSLLSKYPPDITIVLIADLSELMHRWMIRGYGDPQPRYVLLQSLFFERLNNNVLLINTTNVKIIDILNNISGKIIKI
jgi:energy-coupling factor transporter ATP-binding protein EcfA2